MGALFLHYYLRFHGYNNESSDHIIGNNNENR